MCGIVGYLGTREAAPILIDCLQRLEYRGYDSAGVGLLLPGGNLEVTRSTERLTGLASKLGAMNGHALAARVGIGHTRWATHGKPTEDNAHPHRSPDGKIAVVHNGIFENFRELREELSAFGLVQVTQTDTECFPLMMSLLMSQGAGFEDAFRAAVRRMEGKYALACVHADHPGKILLARSGPTLVVGFGEGETFIASDVAPLLKHTRNVAFLEDGDVAELTTAGLSVIDHLEQPATRPVVSIDWDATAAELGSYRHFMHKEIFEQPAAVSRTIDAYVKDGEVALDLPYGDEFWARLDRIVVLACGTSWHAGLVGKFLIEGLARVHVDVDYASEYRYRLPIASENTLAVAITQSGETADTIAALMEAKSLGARTLTICNAAGSQATRLAEATLLTRAGPEIGVASTKAFTTQLTVLTLLALEIAKRRGSASSETLERLLVGLRELPALLERVQAKESQIEAIATASYRDRNALYLGRGSLYPIALEGALKLKEISYIHAEGYPAGEMKHGPIALIDREMPVLALMPADGNRERTLSNLQEAAAREARIIGFVDEGERGLDDVASAVVELPATERRLAPILYSVPLQLFAYHVAALRGCDVDRPRNLAKSVTVE
ncbi:MAG TPA: glutamine--fructose-6-phosphate transaminase (isomerizing) [Polyangiaceae bacterium]|nr:glutamine--fructose-6-phosphate transaminase (isomerizing) [Polyangiaceae bacterium]